MTMVPKALLRRSLFPAIYVYVPLVVGRTMMLILLGTISSTVVGVVVELKKHMPTTSCVLLTL